MRKAARLTAQYFDAALQPSGLSNTQFSLLAVLTGMGSASITRLAEILGTERTTLTRNLKTAEREGLVQIKKGPNARTRSVILSAKGKQTFAAAIPLWEEAQENYIQTLGKTKWPLFLNALREGQNAANKLTG